MDPIYVETAPGELIDKITVLEIKNERITDPARLKNVRTELDILRETKDKHLKGSPELQELAKKLKEANQKIWDLSDRIRELGEAGNFGKEFAEISWNIHLANDERATIKKQVNIMQDSRIIEEKSYKH
jgi:hypothetical protein